MLRPIRLTPNMSSQIIATAINDNFQQLESENRTKTIVDEDSVKRIIIGRYVDPDNVVYYGIFGFDSDGNLRSFMGQDPDTSDMVTDSYDENGNLISRSTGDTITYYDMSGNVIQVNDGASVTFYDTSGNKISVTDATGVKYYNTSGNLISYNNGSTTIYYRTTGTKISETTASGVTFYNTSNQKTATNTGSSLTYYDTGGNTISTYSGTSTIYYDGSTPRIFIGKAPSDGRMGFWISKSGVNVVTELS